MSMISEDQKEGLGDDTIVQFRLGRLSPWDCYGGLDLDEKRDQMVKKVP